MISNTCFYFSRALRIFSTIQQQRSFELSQGKLKSKAKKYKTTEEHLKLSPVVQFDSCKPFVFLCFYLFEAGLINLFTASVKEREWDNIVTCHETETGAHTWRYENKVLGKSYLRSKTPAPVKVCFYLLLIIFIIT
jgi:U3 small nucleolar RNA-associated protein 21